MFLPPPAPRSRPLFALSAAAHAALVGALVVPTLLATPEPPEPDGTVRIGWIPVMTIDATARKENTNDLLRKGNHGGDAHPRAALANGAPAAPPAASNPRAAIEQPRVIPEVFSASGREGSELLIEETGERSEPGIGAPSGTGHPGSEPGGVPNGCEKCEPIAASGPGVTPPVAIETIAPVYPELARRAHVEGVVTLQSTIDVDGSVREVHVVRSASPLLDAAALDAVRRWRYLPASLGNRHVPVLLSVVVTFSLKNP